MQIMFSFSNENELLRQHGRVTLVLEDLLEILNTVIKQ